MKDKTKKTTPGRVARSEAANAPSAGYDDNKTKGRRIDPKWAWHYRVLAKLREQLLRERTERLADSSHPVEPHSMNMADSATDEFDHAMTLRELSANQDALYEIDDAIQRIVAGSYGVCEKSGQPIPPARLKAVPWARFTREAEVQLEKEGVIGRAQIGKLRSVQGPESALLAPTREELEKSEKEEEFEEERSEPPVNGPR